MGKKMSENELLIIKGLVSEEFGNLKSNQVITCYSSALYESVLSLVTDAYICGFNNGLDQVKDTLQREAMEGSIG